MSKLIATGSYLPETLLTNNQLIEQFQIDSSHEWIEQRSGITQRFFAKDAETVANLATKAAQDLLSGLENDVVQEIKLIIVATMSANGPTPSVANQVQAALGINDAWGFDISGACSGFVMALDVAEQMSRTKTEGYTLVIGAEKMSQILDFSDRSTAVLFGDGAGAVLIQNDGTGLPNYHGDLHAIEDPNLSIAVNPNANGKNVMSMLGRDVFNFVNRTVIKSLGHFMTEHVEDYDYLICHQANQRLLDIIAKKLKISHNKIPANISHVANLSAASIPVLLDELVKGKTIALDGSQTIVMCGFGGGLAWGNISITL